MTLRVGDSAEVEREITPALIDAFAALSGDDNPLHMDDGAARAAGFAARVSHGVLTMSLLSTLIGTRLPGGGALWQKVQVEWLRPVYAGDRIVVRGEVAALASSGEAIDLAVTARNQHGTEVMKARAVVALPTAAAVAPVAMRPVAAPAPAAARSDSGRTVLVTGATGGIGRACAVALAASGWDVVVGYRSQAAAAEMLVGDLQRAGRGARSLAIDLAEWPEAAMFDGIDALVHAATPPLEPTSVLVDHDVTLRRYFEAYVVSALRLTRSLEPAFRRRPGGRVVLIGTSAILGVPPPRMSAYVIAKSALIGTTRALALELGPLGATANLVSPGLTPTTLIRDTSPRVQLAEAQRTPTRRNATPEDTAAVVAFLCSAAASHLTGTHLPVTGGAAMA